MITILMVLSAGVLTGFLLVGRPVWHRYNNKLLNLAIYVMLFLLGISVGTNREVIGNLGKIGYESVAIAMASMVGSILLSTFVFKLLFKQNAK